MTALDPGSEHLMQRPRPLWAHWRGQPPLNSQQKLWRPRARWVRQRPLLLHGVAVGFLCRGPQLLGLSISTMTRHPSTIRRSCRGQPDENKQHRPACRRPWKVHAMGKTLLPRWRQAWRSSFQRAYRAVHCARSGFINDVPSLLWLARRYHLYYPRSQWPNIHAALQRLTGTPGLESLRAALTPRQKWALSSPAPPLQPQLLWYRSTHASQHGCRCASLRLDTTLVHGSPRSPTPTRIQLACAPDRISLNLSARTGTPGRDLG